MKLMDMAQTATKGNLMNARKSLQMADKGHELLDRKKKLLMREMAALTDRAKALQGRISVTFGKAFEALCRANITLGIDQVALLAEAIPEEKGVHIRYYSVMGVEIPVVRDLTEEDQEPVMSLDQTNIYFDRAVFCFREVKQLVYELVEVENGIGRLSSHIQKTQKRANALKNIMIPQYTALVAVMSAALEEKEREEFIRLKGIKRMVK